MINLAADIYVKANLDNISNEIDNINKTTFTMVVTSVSKLSRFSYTLYQKDLDYKNDYDNLINFIEKGGNLIRIHIEEGLLKIEKWLNSINAGNSVDLAKYLMDNQDYKVIIQRIAEGNLKYISYLNAVKNLYDGEIKKLTKELATAPNDKKQNINMTISLFKEYTNRIKISLRDHDSLSKRLVKKHQFLKGTVFFVL